VRKFERNGKNMCNFEELDLLNERKFLNFVLMRYERVKEGLLKVFSSLLL